MEIIPVKTRVLMPPQDSLLEVIKSATSDIKEGDILAISSKVVAIDE